LRNAECGKTLGLKCNLRNVPQVKFHKIHLFKFPHSEKYTYPHVHAINVEAEADSKTLFCKFYDSVSERFYVGLVF